MSLQIETVAAARAGRREWIGLGLREEIATTTGCKWAFEKRDARCDVRPERSDPDGRLRDRN